MKGERFNSSVKKSDLRLSLKSAKKKLKDKLMSNIKRLESSLYELKMKHDKLEDEVSDEELRELKLLKD